MSLPLRVIDSGANESFGALDPLDGVGVGNEPVGPLADGVRFDVP